MNRFRYRVAFVVPTKDRPRELRTMLKSLARQSSMPDRIVIVDSSKDPNISPAKEFPSLPINYIAYAGKPSASAQRNFGLSAVSEDVNLVGFLDDDTEFEPDSLEKMMTFWETAPDDLAGAAFNMINHPMLMTSFLKTSPLAEILGLYSKQKGRVLPSGFQTMIGCVDKTTLVDWLPTTAVIWRRHIFDEQKFDEWFEGYSYLEDLDFSYRIGAKHKLAVVANTGYYHHPACGGRGDAYTFGRREVINRVYFVRKNRLSLFRCYVGLFIRFFMTLGAAMGRRDRYMFKRALGNISVLYSSLAAGINAKQRG